ncbi:GMC family oxidoreductase [Ensifer sp.]|jgi:choline dehydrogenase-like flavoprotein|uniref:GMC family oxidoreductase n=1 Tax=Ensifer sp. TaxID=1872086 RepID=UPI002E1400B1|nr:GMC family oxidoreductase [Ensifer sp.]
MTDIKTMIDARALSDEDLQAIGSDVLIVGSGAAACAMATRLLASGLTVTLLETGDTLVDSDSGPYFDIDNKDPFGLSFQIGGATNLWSGRVAPLEDVDVSAANGWPLERSELEGYYRQALELLQLKPISDVAAVPAYDGGSAPWRAFVADPAVSVKRFQWSRPAFNGQEYLKALAAKDQKLTIVYHCRVTKLIPDAEGKRVSGVRAAIGEGRTVELSAPHVVLCAGGLENPRLMLNSREGAFLANDNIGRFFSTHPKANVGRIHLYKTLRTAGPLFSDFKSGSSSLRFGVGVKAEQPGGRLNHYVQFSPRFESLGLKLLEHAQHVVAAGEGGDRPRSNFRRRLTTAAAVVGQVAFNVIGKMGLLGTGGSILVVRGFFDQHPNAEHRVELGDALDPYGLRKGVVRWSLTQEDQASIRTFLEDLGKLLQRHNIGKLVTTLPPVGKPWDITGIHSHFMGTTRMGRSEDTSVIDRDGRVHGVDNLYAGGASVFTSYGYANPVLTVMALAILTADKICQRHKTKAGTP